VRTVNESLDRLESLFAAALRKPPADRAAYLDQACADDPALRERAEALLRAQAAAGSFLESPAPSPVVTVDEQPVGEGPGTIIGAYKLLQQIGEGGMGTVWMAQQTEPVKRVVAVKLIKAGMDSRQVIARFEAERQALALMDHANIARVLEAGTTSNGRPYFVMDLVKGVPITKYCDEHHLTPRQRLELIIPVCQAVQHAHQKGIIHRDIKPSNVLVALYDGQPVPKVIDFGVAKAAGQQLTEKTLVTGFGNIVGTLEYMSPEQAEINQLDIDTRSDIYSLGVLLYELLTGSPPFSRKDLEKAGMLEMLRVIREQEPSKPSTKLSTADGLPTLAANRGTDPAKLTKLVRGELDWIVMQALEKDRRRRYETAIGFSIDVQRYLADEPVLACPPSPWYRLRKFVRRNKRAALAALLVLGVLVIGIIGTSTGMLRATKAEAVAKREAREKSLALGEKEVALAAATAHEIQAKAAQNDAQENLKDALAAVDQMLTRVGQDRLREVPQMEAIRRDLLQDALKFYQKFLQKNSGDPLIRRETAGAYRRLANIHRILGQYVEAETGYGKALTLFAELAAVSPLEPSTRRDVSQVHLELAENLAHLGGKGEEQAKSIQRAVEIAEQLVTEYKNDPDDIDRLVDTTNNLAVMIGVTRPKEAEDMVRRNLTFTKSPAHRGNIYRYLANLSGGQKRYKGGGAGWSPGPRTV
jgi:serine/threonine protein kinase